MRASSVTLITIGLVLLILSLVPTESSTSVKPQLKEAQTIDEVIDILQSIINEAKRNNDQIGYFPALYKIVTEDIRKGIQMNKFKNPPLMEKLDVAFANRYIKPYFLYKEGKTSLVPKSWMVSFERTKSWMVSPWVLEHLLTGMNAHINLDLGVAAAEIINSAGDDSDIRSDVKFDFMKINEVLQCLLVEVEHDLSTIQYHLGTLLSFTGNIDETIVKFGVGKARDHAWEFAEALVDAPDVETQNKLIQKKDNEVMAIGVGITIQGAASKTVLRMMGVSEADDVTKNIEQLEKRHVLKKLTCT